MTAINATWLNYTGKLSAQLAGLSVSKKNNVLVNVETGFNQWREWSTAIREHKKNLFLIGNGASASMASHFATDIAKNGKIRARVFTDMSLITALSNDIDFNAVFAEPLKWYGEPGDMLIAISSSGNSPNIIKAMQEANTIGLTTITLSAMEETNELRSLGDLNFYLQADTYGHAETGHAAILHYWMDLMECLSENE